MADKMFTAIGRRKQATARVRIVSGTGDLLINDKKGIDYFGNEKLVKKALSSLKITSLLDKYNVEVRISGGGKNGQAEAIRHGVARCLVEYNNDLKPVLRKAGYITRDPRAKERKKYGLKRARKAAQFSKR